MLEYTEMNMDHYAESCDIWKNTPGLGLTAGDSEAAIKRYLEQNKGMSLVCIDTEKKIIIGTILCGHDGRRGIIYHLAVKEDYRGKHIGITLLNKGLEKIKQANVERVMAFVKDDNDSGSEFWIKHGFNRRELIPYSKDL